MLSLWAPAQPQLLTCGMGCAARARSFLGWAVGDYRGAGVSVVWRDQHGLPSDRSVNLWCYLR